MAQQTEPPKRASAITSALTLTLLYVALAGGWIAGSTSLLHYLLPQATADQFSRYEITKGLLFVAITAVFLFLLIYRRLLTLIASQEAIRLSEQRYRQLVKTAEEGVWIIDASEKTTFANDKMAELLGYSPQEMLDQPLDRFMDVDALKLIMSDIAHSRQGLRQQRDLRLRHKDGADLWTIVSSTPMYDGQGQYTGVLATITDITARKHAEEALQRSEKRVRGLVERAADALFVHDMAGKIIDVNQQACNSLGYTREELLKLSVSDIEVLNGSARLLRFWREAIVNGPITIEATCRRKDASCYPVEVRLSGFDAESQPLILALVRDVSDRKRAEEALRQSETRFRGIYEESPIGIGLYDVNGCLVDANPACFDIFGLPSIVHVRGHSLFADPNSPPEVLDAVRRGVQISIEFIYDFELVKQLNLYPTTRSGTIHLHALVTPLRPDSHGQLSGYLIHMQDITERKRAEQALRFTQFAMDHAADGIFWRDEQARFVYVNDAACRSLGYTRAELLSMRVHDIVPDMSPEAWIEYGKRLNDRRFMVFETRHRARDGRIFPVEVTANLLEFDGREFVCAFARDITERRCLEEDLRHSQKMEAIGRLAGGVAHDFNNLLAVISGYSESLLRHLPPEDRLRLHAEEIGKAADRGASLTRQLLAFSRRQVVQPQILHLNRIIRDLQEMLRRTTKKNIAIELHLDPALGPIKADPGQMEQVLINLALNARDAMDQSGGVLTVRTENTDVGHVPTAPHKLPPGPYVKLSVQDTGCGMDPELQARIFEPFFTTKTGKGTGLGLSIVYGIVQQSGGGIHIQSQPEQGTAFHILLPRATEVQSAEC